MMTKNEESLSCKLLSQKISPLSLGNSKTFPIGRGLDDLIPCGGIGRGSVVLLSGEDGSGLHSLFFSILAGLNGAGLWTAIVSVGDLGFASLIGLGVDETKLVVVKGRSDLVPATASLLMDGFAVVVIPAGIHQRQAFRLVAKAKQKGVILLVLERTKPYASEMQDKWTGPVDMAFHSISSRWSVECSDGKSLISRPGIEVKALFKGVERQRLAAVC